MIGITSIQTLNETQPLNVAAYGRVSTDHEAQTESFETQTRHYTQYIRNQPGWRLAGVYTDYGVSGTQRKQRTGFNRMMRHCREGRIDKILCKSISRFARNVVDALDAVRELKELGIGVVFEKEGVDTLSLTSEFILSTLAAISQEESRSLSENTLWGIKKRFERGEVRWPKLLGYNAEKTDGKLVITIDEGGASTVREIYRLAIEGINMTDIARLLLSSGTLTVRGDTNWTSDLVKGILRNERFTGDVMCQKTFTKDYLTHKTQVNRGERPKYLIENHHPAIISKEDFKAVNQPYQHKPSPKSQTESNVLTRRVICGECGKAMGRYNITSIYPKWWCSRRNLSRRLCDGHRVYESDVEKAVRMAFLEKYAICRVQEIYGLLAQLKHIHECDNVERERSILRREISIAAQREMAGEDFSAIALTQKLEAKERFWQLLEADWQLRLECIRWMEGFPQGSACIRAFVDELDIKRLRAWAVNITVLSPISYAIMWIDGTQTTVTLDEQEQDHRLADWRD